MSIATQSAAATVDVSGTPTGLRIAGGQITFDESWAPYVQVSLELTGITPGDAVWASLEPRQSPSPVVELAAAMTYPDRPGSSFTGELVVRSLRFARQTRRTVITLESDEALLQDYVMLNGGLMFTAGPWPLLLGEFGILGIVYGGEVDLTGYPPELDDTAEFAGGWVWADGQTAWDAPEAALQASGLRLYANEHREWYLARSPLNLEDLVRLGPAGEDVIEDETEIRLDGTPVESFADAVIVLYRWIDAAGVSYQQSDVAHATPWSKAITITHENTPYPGPGAAARILTRQLALGTSRPVTARSNFDTRPGMWVAIGDDTAGRVRAVTFDLESKRMSLQLRDVVGTTAHSWLLDTPGVAWNDVPAGIDWTEDE